MFITYEMLLLPVLLGVAFFHCVACQDINTSCNCVGYDGDHNPCPGSQSECQPLTYYISEYNFTDDSSFIFLPGIHYLNETHVFSVSNVSNLTLVGYSNSSSGLTYHVPVATVQCMGEQTGFLFQDITNLSVISLRFRDCGFIESGKYSNAVSVKWIRNLYMSGVEIYNASGNGLIGYEITGTSIITYTTIESSHTVSNFSGGNLRLLFTQYGELIQLCNLVISHSHFLNGNSTNTFEEYTYASGVDILLDTNNSVQVTLQNVTMHGNNGGHDGGNLAVTIATHINEWQSSVTVHNCTLSGGAAKVGGGIYISLIANISHHKEHNFNNSESVQVLSVSNTTFQNNTADIVGAGAYIQLHEDSALSTVALIEVSYCMFRNNTILSLANGRGGSAVNIINFHIPGYIPHQIPQYNVSFVSCNFTQNSAQVSSNDSVGSGTFYVEENAVTTLIDCLFVNNSCTGIAAVHSNLVLEGEIMVIKNTGKNGGGMIMCANSVMYLSPNVNVLIQDNRALEFGGGIYAEFECTQAIPPCFFQINVNDVDSMKGSIQLNNNTATAGSAVYGGSVDYCYFFGRHFNPNKTKVFDTLFNITSSHNDLSNVSSNPLRVCFCDETGMPNCNERQINHPMYSGTTLSVSAVVVGQRYGPVPGIVIARIEPRTDVQSALEYLQDSQPINSTNCTDLTYTVYSNVSTSNVTFNLSVANTDFRDAVIDSVMQISIIAHLQPCPIGFELRYYNHYECTCAQVLQDQLKDVTCNISTTSVHRISNSTWWLGLVAPCTIMHNTYCPFDYCVEEDININTTLHNGQDVQCAFKRTGILCGRCSDTLSNILGSSKCWDCSHGNSILRVTGLLVVFALLGIVLILLLGVLHLTVSEGTLNAIVFYMNIVRFNSSVFLQTSKQSALTNVLSVFVAWMNLDFGIEVCFYNGMSALQKTWFQFVFPFYLWFLAALIIFLSRRSSFIVRLFGKNTVKLLATLILHSYSKLLRTIVDTFMYTTISYSNGTHSRVWSVDGNVPYLHIEHAVLFVFAVVVAIFTLPYTLALLFIQCLRKKSNMKVLFWVEKLKPFFDAYTGPYKDSYHFWTGFLLLLRIFLFLSVVINTSKGPILNLTVIIGTVSLLLILIQPGIYGKWQLGILEGYTYFNLIGFSAGMAYVTAHDYDKDKSIILCVGSMFLVFCGVILYHMLKKLSNTQTWRKMKVWMLDKKWPWMKQKPIRSLILSNTGNAGELSSSEDELDPILGNAPPVIRYDQYREPLIGTEDNNII